MNINIDRSDLINNEKFWENIFSEKWVNSCFAYDYDENNYNKQSLLNCRFTLPEEICSKIIDMSNKSDYRLQMILTAAVMCILNKYVSEDNLMIWTSIFKQDKSHEFINTILPIKSSIKENTSFKQFLLEIKNTIVQATENQNYPIEKLLKRLYPAQYVSQSSLIDVAVLLDNIQDKNYMEQYNPKVLFIFSRLDKKLELTIEYNSSLYDEISIRRISDNLCIFLQKVLFEVDSIIDDVEVVSGKEKKQLLVDFNNTKVDYNFSMTIPELFEECVNMYSDNIAVVYEDSQISYKELNKKVNKLSNILYQKKVMPENIVAIYMNPSIEIIIAIMAVLKSGAAYVPIDTSYPKDRVEYMLRDSKASVLITDRESDVSSKFKHEVINICNTSFDDNSDESIDRVIDTRSLAYIIYTSGSTGKSKGVAIEHKSILNSVLWYKKYFEVCKTSSVLQPASFSFDASILLILSALTSGGKLVIINQKDVLNQAKLKDVLLRNDVTHFSIVPSIYKTLLRNDCMMCNGINRVILSGESLNEGLVREHFSKLSNVKLYNGYGPTENSVCTTVYEFTIDNQKVLIGKPLDNTKCFVLKNNKLLPIGAVGELYIQGEGLARGYINNDVLTRERFKECPFVVGSKMYKTGDLVRFDNDGNLKFLGRSDQQVKINGYRIELGEIESSILDIDGIDNALIVEFNDKKFGNFICAYVVCRGDIDVESIRKCLENKLPRYMLPSFFIKIDKIPESANGKIDYNKLLNPLESLNKINKYEPPTNDIEKTLCDIYEKTLGVTNVGINNNFFHIGGDSIKSINLTNCINEELSIKLEVSDIYSNQTIKQLASFIANNTRDENSKHEEGYKEALDELNALKETIIGRR